MLMRYLFIFVLLAVGQSLRAGPLDRKQLPADTRWFIHLDADAGRASTLGQSLLEAVRAHPEARAGLQKIHDAFGVDVLEDIHGITAFGAEFGADDKGVVLLTGRFDRERLLRALRSCPDFRAIGQGGREMYAWTDTGKPVKHNVAAFFGRDQALVGQHAELVEAALDVLEGKAKSLADGDSPVKADAPEGSVLEAAVVGLASAKGLGIQSPVLRECDYGSAAVGEKKGEVFFVGLLSTDAPEVAGKVGALINGAKALAQLQGADHPELTQLLEPLRVSVEGKAVRVEWRMNADSVREAAMGQWQKLMPAATQRSPQASSTSSSQARSNP